jgi:hypothetical protein
MAGQIRHLQSESNAAAVKGDFSQIEILHHFTAGLKAMCADYAYFGIDELR